MTRLKWLKLVFLRYYRSMGLRVLLYALMSIVATLASPVVNAVLGIRAEIDFASVTPVLTILATSMLAVSTFSLSIMVTAHRAAAESATPRMHHILLEDTTTQSVLSVFIGAFVYSLGSLVLYRLGFYPEDAAFAVMGITTLVVVAVIVSLLRWINHLTTLGSLQDSLHTAQARAEAALRAHARHPRLGASALTKDTVLPVTTTPLLAPQTGYLQLIDMAMVQTCLPDRATLYLEVCPGQHVLVGEPLGQVANVADDTALEGLVQAFTFGRIRTHEQDAAFGLITLSEIASKALSPGVNDPGTAIEVVVILKALLWHYAREAPEDAAPKVPNVLARFPGSADLVEAAFATIARDGAGRFDVTNSLIQSLAALSASDDPKLAEAARDLVEQALCLAEEAGMAGRDVARLRSVVACAAT